MNNIYILGILLPALTLFSDNYQESLNLSNVTVDYFTIDISTKNRLNAIFNALKKDLYNISNKNKLNTSLSKFRNNLNGILQDIKVPAAPEKPAVVATPIASKDKKLELCEIAIATHEAHFSRKRFELCREEKDSYDTLACEHFLEELVTALDGCNITAKNNVPTTKDKRLDLCEIAIDAEVHKEKQKDRASGNLYVSQWSYGRNEYHTPKFLSKPNTINEACSDRDDIGNKVELACVNFLNNVKTALGGCLKE